VRIAVLQFVEWAQRVSANPQEHSLLFTLGVSGHIGMFAAVEAAGSTAHVPHAATAAALGVAAAAAGLTMRGLRMALRGALEPVAVGGRGADKGGGDGVLEEIGSPVQWEVPPVTAPLVLPLPPLGPGEPTPAGALLEGFAATDAVDRLLGH
jgi:hypothetical protein